MAEGTEPPGNGVVGEDLSAGTVSPLDQKKSLKQLQLLIMRHWQEWVVLAATVYTIWFLLDLGQAYLKQVAQSFPPAGQVQVVQRDKPVVPPEGDSAHKAKLADAHKAKLPADEKPQESELKPLVTLVDWHWVVFGSVLIFSPVYLLGKLVRAVFRQQDKAKETESDGVVEELAKEIVKAVAGLFKKEH